MKWIKKWQVPKSSGDGFWIVSLSDENTWGCSCPVWKFRRQECHHIMLVKNSGGAVKDEVKKPEYVLAQVNKPTLDKENNRLLVPLVGIPDAHMMEATICYNMLKHGYSMKEIREIRHHVPSSWTVKAITAHVETQGEAVYPEGWYRH